MPFYKLYAGLSGSFGGSEYIKTIESNNENDATMIAYQCACDIYEGYGGMHGLFNYEDALEEDPDLTDEDLAELENEDKENWIEYYAEETANLTDTDED